MSFKKMNLLNWNEINFIIIEIKYSKFEMLKIELCSKS